MVTYLRDTEATKHNVRITTSVFKRLVKLKKIRAMHLNLKNITLSAFLSELLNIVGPYVEGNELYAVNDKLFSDAALAWGEAVQETAKGHPTKPIVLIKVGYDERFNLPWDDNPA